MHVLSFASFKEIAVIVISSWMHHHPADLQASVFVLFFLCFVLHDDVSEVGPDQSDRRESASRASAALIRVICRVQRRRLFLSTQPRVCTAVPAYADGRGSDEHALCFCSETRKSFLEVLL